MLAALVAVCCAAPAQAEAGCNSRKCKLRVASKQCSQKHVTACIKHAELRYRLAGWESGWMRRVSLCESHRNPYAKNPSGSSGLYQFMPGTWATTPYGRHSIWLARYQALAAAWMLRAGRSSEWVCR